MRQREIARSKCHDSGLAALAPRALALHNFRHIGQPKDSRNGQDRTPTQGTGDPDHYPLSDHKSQGIVKLWVPWLSVGVLAFRPWVSWLSFTRSQVEAEIRLIAA